MINKAKSETIPSCESELNSQYLSGYVCIEASWLLNIYYIHTHGSLFEFDEAFYIFHRVIVSQLG